MTRTRRRSSLVAIAAAALTLTSLTSPPAVAQTLTDDPSLGETVAALEMTTSPTPEDLAEAAGELEVEAALLERDDPRRGERLRLAGRYYGHAGEFDQAYLALVASGRAFFASGRHATAAHAFVDAVEAANRSGRISRAWSAARLAGAVLREGRLAPDERQSVLARIRMPGFEG